MEPGLYCHGSPVRPGERLPGRQLPPPRTRLPAEAAILVVGAVGTPVQTAGVHSLGSTWAM